MSRRWVGAGMDWDDRIGRRLRPKDLHTLQTVAELGSMAKASAELGLSQPAISKSIADMELMLGAALFDRSARGVELTEAGRLLVERGKVIFDELRQCVRDIEHLSDPTRGLVRIGTTTPMTAFVSEVIGRLCKDHPGITFHTIVNDTTTLLRQLRERELDAVITRWVPGSAAPEDLAAEVLFKAPLAVLADKRHPLVRRSGIGLADLAAQRWVLPPPETFLGQIVGEIFARRALPLPPARVVTVSVPMQLNLLASGQFLAMLPRRLVDYRANAAWLRALDVDLADSADPVALVTVEGRRMAGAVMVFSEASRAAAKAQHPVSEGAGLLIRRQGRRQG